MLESLSLQKNRLRCAKNVMFSLLCILADRPMGGGFEPPNPPPPLRTPLDDIMHHQIYGVPMGSLLGPALACIFVGNYESKLIQTTSQQEMYYCYVDDTFVVFSFEDECDLSLHSLNSLHPSHLIWLPLFWTCWLKNPLPSSSSPSTGNPHSPVNIYAGIASVHKNVKLT